MKGHKRRTSFWQRLYAVTVIMLTKTDRIRAFPTVLQVSKSIYSSKYCHKLIL